MAIGSFKLPNTVATSSDPLAWVRPADWLAMPTIGTQEFIGLLAITDDDANHIALLCRGAYTVDWGDGVTENVADNVKAQHSYTYSAISSGTLSTRGYKQVLVRVTPQAGQNLTTINLQQQNTILGKLHTVGWLDVAMNGASITSIIFGQQTTVRLYMCERVVIGLTGTITSFASLFHTMRRLQSVSIATSSAVTSFYQMFINCIALKTIPLINTSAGTNFENMFLNCSSLETIPLINTSNATTFQSMFNGCTTLKSIPLLNTPLVTIFANAFQNCLFLETIPLLNMASANTIANMFLGCEGLISIPLINTSNITLFNGAFSNCLSLQLLPNFNTSAGTNFSGIVTGSPSLAKGAFQGTRYAISYASMCLSQSAIVDIFNGLGTAVGTPTINVSSNPGRAALTAAEILIATGKGWTVV